jgi:hypothetical protein
MSSVWRGEWTNRSGESGSPTRVDESDRIVGLGKASEDPAIQMAMINFLSRCPGEHANQNLSEMAKQYPKVFQRAITFWPESALKTKSEISTEWLLVNRRASTQPARSANMDTNTRASKQFGTSARVW